MYVYYIILVHIQNNIKRLNNDPTDKGNVVIRDIHNLKALS